MEPEPSARWLREGQTHEAKNTATALANAVQCYDQAIASLREQPVARVRRELGIAWMNRGNARQKQTDAAATTDAVQAYDEAIALLGALPFTEDFPLRNSIGAAWMNRGHALQRHTTGASLAAALHSYDQAIALLKGLPLETNRSFQLNLAGAWMNRAQALLASESIDAVAAHEAAIQALNFSAKFARTDLPLAEVTLKTYHALCSVLSHQLVIGTSAPLIAETGDAIDEALALVRHWEQRRVQDFRPLAASLYRFGAQFYFVHQPQFLAEFLLENLDPDRAAGAMDDFHELHAVAASSLAQAQADAYNRSLLNPGDERLQQLRQGLEGAEKRRRELLAMPLATESASKARR